MNHRITILKEGKYYDTFKDILPDTNTVLDMLIIGKTPSPDSVKIGHYFQGRHGMSMWNKLEEYCILKKTTQYHDDSLLCNNIGITDVVKVPRLTGNEPSLLEYMEGKQHIMDIIKGHSPKVLFFVYKPILENLISLGPKVRYGFNDNLSKYFYGSRPFLFPMPGTGKVTTDIIKENMQELKDYLKK
jgi:hypothetical protein